MEHGNTEDVSPVKSEYKTSQMEVSRGTTTCPTSLGSSATGVVGKYGGTEEDENLTEGMRRLEVEIKRYEIMLKRAQLENMQSELDKILLKKIYLSGFLDSRHKGGRDQVRRREMILSEAMLIG